ncbi:GNAT family N-acetyltransferase [Breznakia pachnodae]|uniref:Ribosomal protein S18 acetylase RimI-like enzyme n=1 Tax=Breznakia pachnodae TaxID=265178 RepID=A0ABU0DXJ1_9FIRM|nr:GNAT family N-acetyltransferase [Breznakia pachnodae]MDQ0359332.1 ribosomal protein S18 acetylase RimI-like enzyme [Breznakia pachnodae]
MTMNVNVILEKGTEKDIDELENLYNSLNDYLATHTNHPGWRKGIYPVRETAATGIKEDTLYVVRIDGVIAGSIILRQYMEPTYYEVDWDVEAELKNIFVICTFAVHPNYLRMGLGKRMMELVIEYAKTKAIRAIRLDVYEHNIPAITLYESYGFDYIDTVDLGHGEYGLDWFKLYQKIL